MVQSKVSHWVVLVSSCVKCVYVCISFWRPAVLSLSLSNLHCFMSCQVVSLSSHEPFLAPSLSHPYLGLSHLSTPVLWCNDVSHPFILILCLWRGVNSLTANVCREGCKPTPSQKKTYLPSETREGMGVNKQDFPAFASFSRNLLATVTMLMLLLKLLT